MVSAEDGGISAKREQRQSKDGKTANIHLSVQVQDAPEQVLDRREESDCFAKLLILELLLSPHTAEA